MKNLHLLAATMILGLVFSSSAQSATIDASFPVGTLSNGDTHTFTSTSSAVKGLNTYDYLFSGKLAKDTEVTFTITATKVIDFFGLPASMVFGGDMIPSTTNTAQYLSKLENGTLPVTLLSNIGTATKPVYQLVLENLSNTTKNFVAYFAALIDQSKGGTFKVSYAVSSVPLPPSFLLFASGLVVLIGLASRKKASQRS